MAPRKTTRRAKAAPDPDASGGRPAQKAAPAPAPERERAPSGDSLRTYIREISRFTPLTADEEKELGRRIRPWQQKLQQNEVPDAEEAKRGEEALNRMVESNLRFVVSYAKRFRGLGLSFLDLIHEGNLGLIEAAKRFDPERNVKFISYGVWWIRQAIFHALSEHARIIRLPQKMSGQVARIEKARDRLQSEHERPPTSAELAKETDLSEEEVDLLLRVAGDDISLSTAIGEEGGMELEDILEQDSVPPVEAQLMRSSIASQIQAMVAELDDKEQQVLRMRFGLDGEEPRTLQEIGETLGLSRERIRQIESKAKEKLRRNQQIQGLRGYLN